MPTIHDQDQIRGFSGSYRFLSNFHYASITFADPSTEEGLAADLNFIITAPTAEHAYQALKTLRPQEREAVLKSPSPAAARAIGRRITLRPNWDRIRQPKMKLVQFTKYHQHLYLRRRLLDTGERVLVEENHWGDTYWGQCRGQGTNYLGRLLMEVRSELREEKS